VDSSSRVFGYQNLLVCDGSTVPANPGVNPSLTITAMTELAMSKIQVSDDKQAAEAKPIEFSTSS
jgi:cholesterol oxidase